MALYYFDVAVAGRVTHDTNGTELASDTHARLEALRLLPVIAAEGISVLTADQSVTVNVISENRKPIYEARMQLHGNVL